MKNNKMMWLVAIMWLATGVMLYNNLTHQKAQPDMKPPAILMQQAVAKEQAAGDDLAKLQEAIKSYKLVEQSAKKYKKPEYDGREYAGKARLREAIIQEELAHGNSKAINGVVQSYTTLVREYPPQKSEVGQEAQSHLAKLEQQIDKQNSSHVLYKIMDGLVRATGSNSKYSYALALLVITLLFKFITTPLSRAQFKSMKEMQKIQPLMKQLQEKYKNDKQELGKRTMALYKEHGVNPFASCLPLLIQLPVMWLLYWMVRLYQFQFSKGEFLWVGSSLAHKFPAIVGESLAQMDIPLLLIYAASMFVSQRLTVVDPSQAEQQKIMSYMMPVLFTWMFWKWAFPSAFMLYWLLFNIFSTAQQYMIMKPAAVTPEGAVVAAAVDTQPAKKKASTSPGKAKKRRRR